MPTYVALLRAVNVGGTGKLPMSDLRALCAAAGFESVQTYIASGNVVFTSDRPAADVKGRLEAALADYAGKPVGVLLRTPTELAAVLAANPFRAARPNRVLVTFLDSPPAEDAVDFATGRRDEEIALGEREIYIHYGEGMGSSKLTVPAARQGTARNINTVRKLVEMAS
ncbi:MAG: DUF1697 domain-containing protein [Dehalococcoidia bacterium]|nr:DUF1697 domain-containing protein [Dehalococcoidia bacterium]